MRRATGLIAILALLCAVADSARAQDNPLGFYIGAGLGRSVLDQGFSNIDYGNQTLNTSVLGWKALAGFRPLPWLGGEVEYIDFGSGRLGPGPWLGEPPYSQQFLGANGSDRSAAASAVGYLPLPASWPDFFAKLGWAKLWTHTSYTNLADFNDVPDSQFYSSFHDDRGALGYGGGVQFHFGAFAARLEYERFDGYKALLPSIDPSLLCVGLTWSLRTA